MKRKPKKKEAPALPEVRIPDPVIVDLSKMFRMLADKSRLKIVLALLQEGRLHVNAIRDILNKNLPEPSKHSQPAISHHLTLMRGVGLVEYDREGKNNYYYIAGDKIRTLLECYFAAAGSLALDLGACRLAFTQRKMG
ncbi:MAG: metalloregulator ArsR/SmtB family transcription factor [Gemmataceae bacterium]|nr:metalloregulator ArsR/SmtB family transcription factor [Gemmataceae bacterium]